MKNETTRELFAYWDTCRGARAAPDRTDIEPGAIRRILGDTFILGFDPLRGHPFRIAGTRLCALFGRELKERPFRGLWAEGSAGALDDLVTIIAAEKNGVVAAAHGETADRQRLELELLLLPLGYRRGMPARLLGALSAVQRPYWAGVEPLGALTLGVYRHIGPALDVVLPPRFAAVPTGESPRRRFVVLEGGRSD